MRTDVMSVRESTVAAMNLEYIESILGYRIPAGMIDATELGDHILSTRESRNLADNIHYIMLQKNSMKKAKVGFFDYLWLGIFSAAFVLFIGGAILLSIIN